MNMFTAIPRQLGSGLTLAAFALAPLQLIAADPGAPAENRPSTPVTVQGVVEVINDVLHTPFLRTFNTSARELKFDVPDGKRLVIETIAFETRTPAGDVAPRVSLVVEIPTGIAVISLGVQFSELAGPNIVRWSIFSMKLRVDSEPGNNGEVKIQGGGSSLPAGLQATVAGYLVDI